MSKKKNEVSAPFGLKVAAVSQLQAKRQAAADIDIQKYQAHAKAARSFEIEAVVVRPNQADGEPVRFVGTADDENEALAKAHAFIHQFASISHAVTVRDNPLGKSYAYVAPGGIVGYVNVAEVK